MTFNVCVVQGSSRGIGRSLVRALISRSAGNANGGKLRVVATSSLPVDESRRLILEEDQESKFKLDPVHTENLTTLKLDVKDENSIERAAKELRERFGLGKEIGARTGSDDQGQLALLINVSGMLIPEKSITRLSQEDMLKTFQINTFGHLLTLKHFFPLLTSKPPSDPSTSLPQNLSIFASLSARLGSISQNQLGGWYSYRGSKSALNQSIVSFQRELDLKINNRANADQKGERQSAIAVALHPGTVVGTGISKGIVKEEKAGDEEEKGVHTPDVAAEKLLDVLGRLKKGDGARFLDYEGRDIPW